jgi:hypothetical protein
LSELGVTPEATNKDYPSPFQIIRWLDLYDEAMKKMGFNFRIAHSFKQMLTDAGFVDIVEEKLEVPWGAWPKDRRRKAIGLWHLGMCLPTFDCRSNADPLQNNLSRAFKALLWDSSLGLLAGRRRKSRSSWSNCGNNWMIGITSY